MWYDKRWMRMWFYFGAMFVIVGVGIYVMDHEYRLAAALTMCLGAALMVFGFTGMKMNILVEQEIKKKRRRPSSPGR